MAGRERVHVRVAVALAEVGDEPQELDQQLVVAQRREPRDEPVGRGAVLRPRDRVVRVRVDPLELGEVVLDVRRDAGRGGRRRAPGDPQQRR